MGGNSGIYYGIRRLTDDEKYGDDPTLTFTPEQIEGDQIPVIDDLILNLPPDGSSGGFYRVLSSDEDEIMTQKIAVMGSGTGGGSGGPSDSPTQGTIAIKYITPKNSTILSGDSFKVEFEFEAFDSAGDPITEAANAVWKINGQSITQKIYHGYNYLEVSKYLNSSLDNNKISIVVTMDPDTGITVPTSKTWNVKVVDLRLEWPWNYSEDEYRKDSTFTLKWTPYGNIDCTTHIIFDNAYEEGVTYFKYDIPSHLTGKEYTSEPMPSLSYGVHTCEMYITAKINETDLEEMRTPSVFHEITFTRNGSSTLLTVPYYEKLATQYDTLNIPFLVYDPDLEKCNISFYVND